MSSRIGDLQISVTEFTGIGNGAGTQLFTEDKPAHRMSFSHRSNRIMYIGLSDVSPDKYIFLIESSAPFFNWDLTEMFEKFGKEVNLKDIYVTASGNNGEMNLTIYA